MAKNRIPLMASERFMERMKGLQKKIRMKKGEEISMRDLTEEISKMPLFENIEKALLEVGDVNMDIKIRFDRRFK